MVAFLGGLWSKSLVAVEQEISPLIFKNNHILNGYLK